MLQDGESEEDEEDDKSAGRLAATSDRCIKSRQGTNLNFNTLNNVIKLTRGYGLSLNHCHLS